jgi:lysophospholipase L1-like esterase
MLKIVLTLALMLVTQISEKKILFVGDSMTSYTGGWHHQLAKKLGKQYANVSIPGKRTDWMKLKLIETLKTDDNFSTCFIYGGINDGFAYVKVESALKNVQDMVDICNKHGIQPVVVLGYDPSKVMVNFTTNKDNLDFHRKRYIQIQELFMTQLKNCKVIPIAQTIERLDSEDGVHFKSSGHKKFADWVYENYKK